MSLGKYSQYQDLDLEWLKEIPLNWNLARLKDIGFLQNGLSKGGDYFGKGFRFIGYSDIFNDQIAKAKGLALTSKEEQKSYSVKKGDVFFTRTSETIDEIGIAGTCLSTIPKATFSGFTIRFRSYSQKLHTDYSKFYFRANINSLYLSKEISLVTRASLSQGVLGSLPVLLPPIDEQTQIANYLDAKTQAIEQKIKLLKTKKDKYLDLRKSLINETITKGLNSEVELKDSEIKWLGKIPKHWKVKRIKDIGVLYSGLSGKKGDDFNQDKHDKNKGFLPFTNIAANITIDTEKLGTVVIEEKEKQNKVKKNDIFFLMSSEGYEDLGKASLLTEDISETYLNSFCKGLRPTSKLVYPKFLNWMLFAPIFRERLLIQGKGFTRINLKMEKINDFKITIPPIEEQKEIAEYLDTKTSKIDKIVTNIEKQIDVLVELKKTLINDVVTGKLKVT